MNKRLSAISAASLAIAIVLVTFAAVTHKSPDEREQIDAADRIATRFDATIEGYVASTARNASDKNVKTKKDAQELLSFIDNRTVKYPRLPTVGTTAYGRSHSKRYKSAFSRQKLALSPLKSLSTYLRTQAVPYLSFAEVGVKLVKLNPAKLLGTQNVYTGAPLRDLVLPAYENAESKLKKQVVPPDSELLRLDLMTYVTDVIAMTKGGATDIDAGKPFRFDFGTRPQGLYTRLTALQSSILTEVSSRIEELGPVK